MLCVFVLYSVVVVFLFVPLIIIISLNSFQRLIRCVFVCFLYSGINLFTCLRVCVFGFIHKGKRVESSWAEPMECWLLIFGPCTISAVFFFEHFRWQTRLFYDLLVNCCILLLLVLLPCAILAISISHSLLLSVLNHLVGRSVCRLVGRSIEPSSIGCFPYGCCWSWYSSRW